MHGNTINIDEKGNVIEEKSILDYDEKTIKKALKVRNIFAHPTWFAKKEVFIRNNGYRNIETCEDYDFLLRCLQKRCKLGVVPRYLLKYRVRDNSICNSKSYFQFKSVQIVKKYYKNGKIAEKRDILNDIEKVTNNNKEEQRYLKISKFNKEFLKMPINKKIIYIPKIIFLLIINKDFRRIIKEHIQLRIILKKGKRKI